MNRTGYLLAGIIGSFALSVYLLIIVPQQQLGSMQPQFKEEDGKIDDIYPVQNVGLKAGRAVYAAEGCMYCHSQQIRDQQYGLDVDRGWGHRRTVARDYLFDDPPFLGSMRIGPDLSNVGWSKWRNEPENEDPKEKPAKRDRAWHFKHLYNPRVLNRNSNMPPFRHLFEKVKIGSARSPEALDVPVADGYQIIPTQRAKDLVDYLLSLDKSHDLKEVKTAPEVAAK